MKKYLNTFWVRLVIVLLMAGICAWLITEHNWLWLSVAIPTLAWTVWSFYRLYTYHTRIGSISRIEIISKTFAGGNKLPLHYSVAF